MLDEDRVIRVPTWLLESNDKLMVQFAYQVLTDSYMPATIGVIFAPYLNSIMTICKETEAS